MTTLIFKRGTEIRRIRTNAPQTAINMYTVRGWTLEGVRFI